VVCDLFDERHNPLFAQLGTHFENARSWAVAIAEHRAVVDAIARQSPPAAREAMARHLANSHDRFTANWPSEPDTPTPKAAARKSTATKPPRASRKVA
jgi:DNA-binding GntR family transcriptional regulator